MTTRRTDGFIQVGGVAKPHGIRGEFCIKSYADSPSLFGSVAALFLQDGNKPPKPFVLRSWREHKGLVLLKCQGVDDRDEAEALRGFAVLVHEDDLPAPEEGQHYLYEMLGCRVRLQDGADLGTLEQFFETAEQDTWVIITDDGKEILLPAVPEFVLDVDLDEEVILVDPPEGLIDLYLNPEPPQKKKPRRRTSKKKPRPPKTPQAE
ncbi:ribosome maturation factor RimM [Pseudodesulfovibrio piezophilus]|uniref:Ribosome maturation factor RimM n=1 Tax=Pseudodesulfovibrio piezophilus (strain DSM 21447 / JCM 15486 / C1TLV30) TaxID=1322246 RepID=M1WSK3_PSEP2|nr:ribosome maturation factor RimM [Pseudodesulfovibrio piezophilus]CCH48932.1 Ribosome maturation factor rimM [Pseudodesulfovibrio piezophilus C1TLV30]